MEKEKLLSALTTGRADFLTAIQGLSDQEMQNPGVVEQWSVKDILVHLTRWEAEIIKLLWQAKQGITPTTVHFSPTSVDDLNEIWYKESQTRSLKIVMDDFLGVRKQTVRRVEEISQSVLIDPQQYAWLNGKQLWEWIAVDSFEHEAEHGEQIRAWQSKQGWNK
jgi:hypothetical protein